MYNQIMPYENLFSPYERGALAVQHRIALAPLTRNRAKGTVPGAAQRRVLRAARRRGRSWSRRAPSPAAVGQGYLDIAGPPHRRAAGGLGEGRAAVAEAGDAKLVIQLMHTGRVAHP